MTEISMSGVGAGSSSPTPRGVVGTDWQVESTARGHACGCGASRLDARETRVVNTSWGNYDRRLDDISLESGAIGFAAPLPLSPTTKVWTPAGAGSKRRRQTQFKRYAETRTACVRFRHPVHTRPVTRGWAPARTLASIQLSCRHVSLRHLSELLIHQQHGVLQWLRVHHVSPRACFARLPAFQGPPLAAAAADRRFCFLRSRLVQHLETTCWRQNDKVHQAPVHVCVAVAHVRACHRVVVVEQVHRVFALCRAVMFGSHLAGCSPPLSINCVAGVEGTASDRGSEHVAQIRLQLAREKPVRIEQHLLQVLRRVAHGWRGPVHAKHLLGRRGRVEAQQRLATARRVNDNLVRGFRGTGPALEEAHRCGVRPLHCVLSGLLQPDDAEP